MLCPTLKMNLNVSSNREKIFKVFLSESKLSQLIDFQNSKAKASVATLTLAFSAYLYCLILQFLEMNSILD